MQRRQFRIESLLAAERALLQPREKAASGVSDGDARRLARGAAELACAMEAMEKACQVVLGTAERVDENARTLGDVADEQTRALARDIREQMARVFEVCNFQDLAGQRITKVIAMLTGSDERRAVAAPACAAGLVNGPRLDGANGHVSQDEVDALFG